MREEAAEAPAGESALPGTGAADAVRDDISSALEREHDALVIGAGVFGQTIAAALRRSGASVLVVDRGEERAGSKPSAGLIKPSWFSGVPAAEYGAAIELLDSLFGIQELGFEVRFGGGPAGFSLKRETILRCDPAAVAASGPTLCANVVSADGRGAELEEAPGERLRAKFVILAGGAWSGELAPKELSDLSGKVGVAFRVRGELPSGADGTITPWAPYKQVVAFRPPGEESIWIGDGTAILHSNWDDERAAVCLQRCLQKSGVRPSGFANVVCSTPMFGIRPFVRGKKFASLERGESGMYIATGGGKMGALGAGLCAARLLAEVS